MTKSAKAAEPAPVNQPADDDGAIALQRVAFRHQDDNLRTSGLELGSRVENGVFTGAVVQAMYATPVGIVVELALGDRAVTVLHTGDTDAVVA